MSTTRLLVAIVYLLAGACTLALTSEDRKSTAVTEEERERVAAVGNLLLKDGPLTIVFQQWRMPGREGAPYDWCWSINSAGEGELTVRTSFKLRPLTKEKTTRQKLVLSGKQLAAIRKVFREERLFNLKGEYGPPIFHGGWSTLTVVVGEHVKQVHFLSSWSWVSHWERDKDTHKLADMAPAVRIWLAVCEAVDPDGKVLEERKEVAKVIAGLKK
jgi:hypothetical protein